MKDITLLTIVLATPLFLSSLAPATPSIVTATVNTSSLDNKSAKVEQSDGLNAQTQAKARKSFPTGNPLLSIPLSTLDQTRQRPLFTPSRRPPAPITPVNSQRSAPQKHAVEQPQLALIGTIVGNANGYGFFIDPATKAFIRLKIGSDYQGWILRSVRRREVVLEKDHLSMTLSLLPDERSQTAIPM